MVDIYIKKKQETIKDKIKSTQLWFFILKYLRLFPNYKLKKNKDGTFLSANILSDIVAVESFVLSLAFL